MGGRIEARLEELGIALPAPVAPLADYVPWVQAGSMLYVSGQLPIGGDRVVTGQLTAADHVEGAPAPDTKLAEAVEAARICAVNLIAQVKAATGDLDRVVRVVKLTGFVNCDGGFEQQPQVVNGASSLLGLVFGEAGRHARSAVGCAALPRGAMVEVEAIFEIA
ncbi:MAG TPA: RidA family protein [Thermohalobaculum sp.]|nr:RidA family protein [Thermohalobaculum sp.]